MADASLHRVLCSGAEHNSPSAFVCNGRPLHDTNKKSKCNSWRGGLLPNKFLCMLCFLAQGDILSRPDTFQIWEAITCTAGANVTQTNSKSKFSATCTSFLMKANKIRGGFAPIGSLSDQGLFLEPRPLPVLKETESAICSLLGGSSSRRFPGFLAFRMRASPPGPKRAVLIASLLAACLSQPAAGRNCIFSYQRHEGIAFLQTSYWNQTLPKVRKEPRLSHQPTRRLLCSDRNWKIHRLARPGAGLKCLAYATCANEEENKTPFFGLAWLRDAHHEVVDKGRCSGPKAELAAPQCSCG